MINKKLNNLCVANHRKNLDTKIQFKSLGCSWKSENCVIYLSNQWSYNAAQKFTMETLKIRRPSECESKYGLFFVVYFDIAWLFLRLGKTWESLIDLLCIMDILQYWCHWQSILADCSSTVLILQKNLLMLVDTH